MVSLYQMDTTLLWDELFCTQLHYFILKEKYSSLEGFSTKGEKKEKYSTLVWVNLLELVTLRKIYSGSNLVRISLVIWFWTTVSLILCSICYQHCCCWRRKFSSLFWHPEDIGTAFGGYHYEENILKMVEIFPIR